MLQKKVTTYEDRHQHDDSNILSDESESDREDKGSNVLISDSQSKLSLQDIEELKKLEELEQDEQMKSDTLSKEVSNRKVRRYSRLFTTSLFLGDLVPDGNYNSF